MGYFECCQFRLCRIENGNRFIHAAHSRVGYGHVR